MGEEFGSGVKVLLLEALVVLGGVFEALFVDPVFLHLLPNPVALAQHCRVVLVFLERLRVVFQVGVKDFDGECQVLTVDFAKVVPFGVGKHHVLAGAVRFLGGIFGEKVGRGIYTGL